MSTVSGSGGHTGGRLGKRNLTTVHAVAQALAIGPMFSAAIILGSISRPDIGAGWNATLAVLVAGLGVVSIAYTVSLYARRYAGAGAIYEYLVHGAHRWVGIFFAGFFFVGTLFLGGGGIYLGLGILTDGFWKAHVSHSGPAWWVWGLIGLGLVLVLNYLGVRLAIRAMLAFAAASFIPMLILALVIIAKGGESGNSLSVFNWHETSLFGISGGGVLGGVLLGILLFVGFEAAASIGEESSDPHRSIPRALVGTVSVAAVFFVFMSYAFSIGYGKKAVGEAAWAFSPSVMDDLGTKYISSWYAGLLDVIVILDATALALAICVLIGRGFFALGRDGLLPKVFAKTSRHDTPWVGNLMVAVGGVGLMIIIWSTDYLHRFLVPGPAGKLIPAFPNNQFAVFILSATIGSFAIELVYLALAVFSFRLVREGGNKPWQYAVCTVAVATPVLGFYGALSPSPHDRSNYNWEAAFWAIGLVVVAVVWFAVLLATRRQNVDSAAAHAAEHHGVPPLDENLDFGAAPPDTVVP